MEKKKKYTKPAVKKIRLVPEEAVLAGCKTKPGLSRAAGAWGHCNKGGPHGTRCVHNSIS